MGVTGVDSAPATGDRVRAVAVSAAMVQQRAADLVKAGKERVLLLRARPEWTAGDVKVGDQVVRVLPGISQLGILDVYAALEPTEYAVILTDRPSSDLGDAVLARAYKQQIEMPDEWQAVPRLFPGAREVSRELRRLDWAATALLDHQPVGGWPRSPELAVSASHALGSLLGQVLGLGPSAQLDDAGVLLAAGTRKVRAAWVATDESLRRRLIEWASGEYGAPAAFALKVAQRQEHVPPLAVGLAIDVLWPEDGSDPSESQVAARTRVEKYVEGKPVAVADAKAAARVAKAIVLRAGASGTAEIAIALQQAEALLSDLGWAEGAAYSTVLAPGYRARLRRLAAALTAGTDVEEALAAVQEHRDGETSEAPIMAVRLHRWLATAEATTKEIGDDIRRQVDDGAWVDAALGMVWSGSDDAEVAGVYRDLVTRARSRRAQRDEVASSRLAAVASVGDVAVLGQSAIGVERLLGDVVAPWRNAGRVLLVVLDGLSSAIATSLAGEVARLGLVEYVPATGLRRLGAVAALPSLTQISRASLFCGEVRSGGAEDEKKGLTRALPGSVLFHKSGLRGSGGAALPQPVTDALNSESTGVVGVVINAIDDATHKNDTSGWEWRLDQLPPLRSLVEAAVTSRRTVIITSDHGHVIERDTEALSVRGADARWHSGSVASAGEVLVRGPRVVAADDAAVLLWREDAHFGPRRAGYHGGASLAEVTVPVLVFQRASTDQAADGWVPAPPQTPSWWNEPARVMPAAASPAKPKKRARPAKPVDQDALFAVEPAAVEAAGGLIDALLASPVYADQLQRAGRLAQEAGKAERFLRALYEWGGRAHRDSVASGAEIAASEVGQVFAAVRRLVNLDGYAVVELDSDGETYRLDVALLREQFLLGGVP